MRADTEPRLPAPPILWVIVGAIAAAYVGYVFAPAKLQFELEYALVLNPMRFHQGNPLNLNHWYEAFGPLIGHAFLHVAWWHAAVNAFFLFLLGRLPALRLGAWRFAFVCLAATLGGALTFLALNWNDNVSAVGASGAVCGVFTAYFMSARPRWRDAFADPRVRNPFLVIFLLNVPVMAIASAAGIFPIAWEAHLGGFIGGGLAYIALERPLPAPAFRTN